MEKKNKPAIRFKGFEEEWNIEKLTTIADIIGGGTPSTLIPDYWNGNIDWYSPTEVGDSIYVSKSIKKITQLGLENSSAKILPANKTILFTSRAGIGDMAILAKEAATNQGFQSLVLKKGFHTYFIYSANDKIKKYALSKASGSTFLEISSKVLGNMELFVPVFIEQQKVGNFFENIDQLITQHQQKHSKLQALKKAMLSKMFPKQGQTVPEIRFKGFEGDWVEKTLKEIANEVSDGNWIESNHIFEAGEYRIIQTGNLGIGKYLDKSNNAKFFFQKDFDEVRGNEIFPGDILISRLAEPAGRTIILPETGYRMVTAVDVSIIRPNDSSFDSTFLMTHLNRTSTLNSINENVSGTSHKRISRRNLEKTKLSIPLLEEQKLIGNYFKNLDTLINNHETQITKLQNIKKAFLAKMFV